MEINKKLDIDNDIEFLESGDMAQASNIVVNNTNGGILNENAIEQYFDLYNDNEKVVGYIACSDEFIIFTNLSKIFRCKESTGEKLEINTNWKWQGGDVIGAYTYNINKELIISITELNAEEDVPLKIINLDKPEYINGQDDSKYTLNPEIPQFNLVNYSTINGVNMYRGVYNFFIRFKKGDEYTAWYKIGYPIILHDKSYNFVAERYVYNRRYKNGDDNTFYPESYVLSDTVNNDVEKVSKNIVLGLAINDKTHSYDAYQIGYIVNTVASEIKIYNTADYNITNRRVTITGTNNSGDFSLDDLTSTFFNVYNVKTLCNYNNRLYIANYKEENPNSTVKDIVVSGIRVKAVKLENETNPLSDAVVTTRNVAKTRAVDTRQATSVTELVYNSKYVVKLKIKLKYNDSDYVEFERWFYSNTTHSYKAGEVGLFFDMRTILNSVLLDSTKEINGRPYLPQAYNDCRYLCVSKVNNEFISRFDDYVGSEGFSTIFTSFTWSGVTYESSDFIVEEVYKVDVGNNNPPEWWFCNPAIDFTERDTYPDVAKNLFIRTMVPYEDSYGGQAKTTFNGKPSAFKSTSSGSVNGYLLRYDCDNTNLYLFYTNFFLEEYLEAKYPGSTRKYKFQYKLPSGSSPVENEDFLDLDSYSRYIKESVRVMYNAALKRLQLCANAVNVSNYSYGTEYTYVEDEVRIIPAEGEEFTFNITELNDILPVTVPNKDKTVEDFNNEYSTVYQWNDDREPNNGDFDPTLKYSITYYKHGSAGKTLAIDVSPTIIGFRNKTVEGNVIKVDKDFALMIPFKDWFNNTHSAKCNGLEGYRFNPGQWSDPTTDQGIVSQLYIAFVKDSKRLINNVNNYTAYLLKVTDDSNLMNITTLLPYTDERYNLRVYDLSSSPSWEDVEFPVFNAPVDDVYDDSDSGIDTDFHAEITKYAINNAIYNFFIHYVYPNGTYTDGIKIDNPNKYNEVLSLGTANDNGTTIQLTYEADEDTKVADVKRRYTEFLTKYKTIDTSAAHPIVKVFDDISDVRVCNIFPKFNADGIALYKNTNGDRLFRGSLNGTGHNLYYNKGFKFVFDNIPMYEGFVGYFISYEKSEPILTAECLLGGYGLGLGVAGDYYNSEYSSFNAYYPEFDLVKKISGNILYTEKTEEFDISYNEIFEDAYHSWDVDKFTVFSKNYITSIKNITVYAPNDLSNNRGRQGVLAISCRNNVNINNRTTQWEKYITYGLILNIVDDIYLKKSKELISLGYIKYVDYVAGETYNYGYEKYNYNYDYYKVSNNIYDFSRYGVNYDEINPAAKTNGNTFYNDEFPPKNYHPSEFYHCPIIGITMNSYSLYPTFAKNIKSKPISKYYNFRASNSDTSYIYVELVTHLYTTMVNDLYELKANFYDYADKLIANYDEDNYANFITEYDKTIRRSDVISNESVENKWKKFRPEQYKIIAENKGAIINLVGIGGYLIAHCEHSMFIFNRDSSMRTEDKDVQLVIPDAFDIDYVEMFTSTRGYAGIQKVNQFVCSNYGYIFYDSDAHKLYRFDENNLDEITPGTKNLFKHEVVDINFAIDERNERIICIGTVNIDNIPKRFAISYSFNSKYWISTHSYWYSDCFNTKNNAYFINNELAKASVDSFNLNKFGSYTNIINDSLNVFKTELTEDNKPCSYIDVVFNNNNVDKVLNYISYIVNKATDDNYSGLRLLIYTNCCYTDYVDISIPKRTMKDYKHPYYRFGQWIFNWFRNKVANIDTKNPIIRGNGKLHPDTKLLTKTNLNDALVVGKYFVVRFVFYSDDKRISVDDIQCY